MKSRERRSGSSKRARIAITEIGGAEGDRTPDLRIANAALCQTELLPHADFDTTVSSFSFQVSGQKERRSVFASRRKEVAIRHGCEAAGTARFTRHQVWVRKEKRRQGCLRRAPQMRTLKSCERSANFFCRWASPLSAGRDSRAH